MYQLLVSFLVKEKRGSRYGGVVQHFGQSFTQNFYQDPAFLHELMTDISSDNDCAKLSLQLVTELFR